jgi:hypothetical protein
VINIRKEIRQALDVNVTATGVFEVPLLLRGAKVGEWRCFIPLAAKTRLRRAFPSVQKRTRLHLWDRCLQHLFPPNAVKAETRSQSLPLARWRPRDELDRL